MKPARPIIEIPLTTSDKILEAVCWSLLAAIWLITTLSYSKLPETIPVHFNAMGKIDGLGSKDMIWFLPGITSALVIGLSLLNRKPHIFNFPVEITPQNAAQNYKMGTRLLRYIKLFITLVFGTILLTTIKASEQDYAAGSNPIIIALLVCVMLFPVVILIYVVRQSNKTTT